MVSIKFIAAKAGVSIATVSRVMNKSKKVSPELEKKVLDAVIKYKYYPNVAARSLAHKRSFLIAILIEDNINQFQGLVLPKISQYISKAGYQAVISIVGPSLDEKVRAMEELKAKQVDGVIALFYVGEMEAKRIRSKVDMPFISSEPLLQNISYFTINKTAAYEAINYLIGLGHQKIAGLFSDTANADGYLHARYEGYKKAIQEAGLDSPESYCIKGDIRMENCANMINQLLILPVRPTAVFCVSDELAIGAMFYLTQQGYKIPEDISIIGYDGIPLGRRISPRLTTVEQPYEFWLEWIVKDLIHEIEHKEPELIDKQTLDANLPFLFLGETCRSIGNG